MNVLVKMVSKAIPAYKIGNVLYHNRHDGNLWKTKYLSMMLPNFCLISDSLSPSLSKLSAFNRLSCNSSLSCTFSSLKRFFNFNSVSLCYAYLLRKPKMKVLIIYCNCITKNFERIYYLLSFGPDQIYFGESKRFF